MIEVHFITLIPYEVKKWIIEQGFDDCLLEAQSRLFKKLSYSNTKSYFANNGTVHFVKELENGSWIGECSVKFDVENEENAKLKFKEIFIDSYKKGQKFKITSFEKVENHE